MFIQKELAARLAVLHQYPIQKLEVLKFDSSEFKCPSSEQEIIIHWGDRLKFDDVLHFWLVSIQSDDWSYRSEYFLPYAQSGKCLALSEVKFNNLANGYLLDLKYPPSLPLHSESSFIGALQMYDDWNDIAAVAAYANSYISFYWSTSA